MRNEKRFEISIFQKKKPFSTRLPSISIQIHPLSCVLIIIIASARSCTKEFTISPLHTLHGTTHPSYQRKERRNKNLSRRLTVCELLVYYLCLFVVIIIIAKRFHFFLLLLEVPRIHIFFHPTHGNFTFDYLSILRILSRHFLLFNNAVPLQWSCCVYCQVF